MNTLFLTSEATPFIKVGGLADVAGELPPILQALGAEMRMALPFYPAIQRGDLDVHRKVAVKVRHAHGGQPAVIYVTERNGVVIYLVDGDPVRKSEAVYGDPAQDAGKFIFTALAAFGACEQEGWQAGIVHAQDWHMAPAVAWLHAHREDQPFWNSTHTLLTVHNLPYMGAGGEQALEAYGIQAVMDERLPAWARHLPLPVGLSTADWISTVSPTYAQEIQTPEFGCGLEMLLRARSDRLVGILNGIDAHVWNPQDDPALPAPFSPSNLAGRRDARRALLESLALSTDSAGPLIGMVTRLDRQKGVDLALDALANMLDLPWQLVILGTGDQRLEQSARQFAVAHPHRISAVGRFDPSLARRIYAGSDMILIPSRYEPCGLAQMIAMRYGSVPVVRATGGLKDTVVDHSHAGGGTGFVFDSPQAAALETSLRRACQVFQDQQAWSVLQGRGMREDFSWQSSAEKYLDLYRRAG